MSDVVPVPADRLADLERIEAAAMSWLKAWVTAQSITSATDGKTALAFESSKRLAAAVRASTATSPARG